MRLLLQLLVCSLATVCGYILTPNAQQAEYISQTLLKPADATDLETYEDAVAAVVSLRALLRSLSQQQRRIEVSPDGEVVPELPAFLADERAEEAKRAAADQRAVEEEEKRLAEGTGVSGDCTLHLSCRDCVGAGCGWCLGGRRCVRDEPWHCRGDHDHVGLGGVGKHTVCPTVEEAESRNRDRARKREEARVTVARSTALPPGSYTASCDACSLQGTALVCERCIGSGGQKLRSELDLKTCSGLGQTVGNSFGTLVCEEPEISLEDARRRASDRLRQREAEELARVRDEKDAGDVAEEKEREERRAEVLRHAQRAVTEGETGQETPYETLGLDSSSCTQGDIRRAYRRLTLRLHPDKHDASLQVQAEAAFRNLVAAFETIADPERRAAFDDYGGDADDDGGFSTYWEYEQSGAKDTRSFFKGSKYVTNLSERVWDRRLVGDSVWLVLFYAPWCGHCQRTVPTWKAVAAKLAQDSDTEVEVGAVNCEKEKTICGDWFDVPAYPTVVMLNEKWGTQHILHDATSKGVDGIVATASEVASEWRYLFAWSDVKMLETSEVFHSTLRRSSALWVVLFIDGLDCASCKTARTNMLRVSAALRGMVEVATVDCSVEGNKKLCYEEQAIPQPPHAAVVKVWPRIASRLNDATNANRSQQESNDGEGNVIREIVGTGEILYSSNEVEPHIALQLTERAVRMALASEVAGEAAISGKRGDGSYEDEKEPEKPNFPPNPPRQPMWNGPKRNAPLPWDGSGGKGRMRQQIARG